MATRFPALHRTGTALARASRAMLDYKITRDAAAISYFSLFALFPAVLVLLAVTNDIMGLLELERKAVVERIISFFPVSRKFLDTNINQIVDPSPALVLSCLVVVVWTSAWVFGFMENALNRAWGVQKRRTFWESRFRSITVVVLGGSILLSSAGITAVVSNARKNTTDTMGYADDQIINWLWSIPLMAVGILLAILVFFSVFKLMPDRRVTWREALSGSIVSSIFWQLGSYIFVQIVPYFDYERVYGRMGAIIALMAWVYTSNLILLFGANFSAQLHGPADVQFPIGTSSSGGSENRDHLGGKIRSFPRSR